MTVTTNATGNFAFVGTFPPVPAGRFITATATDQTTGDTSEFAACRTALQAGISVGPLSLQTTEANEGVGFDAELTVRATTVPVANVVIPMSVQDSTEGAIVSQTPLTITPAMGTAFQTVRINGVDDGIDDGNLAYAVVLGPDSSADPNYNGVNPAAVLVINDDNDDQLLQCAPRPKVNVSVAKIGAGQLRATASVGTNPGTQNEVHAITWTRFDTTTVVVDGLGPVQQGQVTPFGPLTQAVSFVITRTPGAPSGTVRLTVTDACGAWPTFVGGGPNAW